MNKIVNVKYNRTQQKDTTHRHLTVLQHTQPLIQVTKEPKIYYFVTSAKEI